MSTIKNSLGQCHEILEKIIINGDTVIDATAGNGHDTAFLAGLAGEDGRVYSFDIQDMAIENTKRRVEKLGLANRVSLIHDGHQNMDKYVKEAVRAVVFNLGYLPKGDHDIHTEGNTTVEAIEKAMELIVPGGVVILVVYYGGDSGFNEKEYVLDYIKTIDSTKFAVMQTEFVNQPNCPPILVCIEKL